MGAASGIRCALAGLEVVALDAALQAVGVGLGVGLGAVALVALGGALVGLDDLVAVGRGNLYSNECQ